MMGIIVTVRTVRLDQGQDYRDRLRGAGAPLLWSADRAGSP